MIAILVNLAGIVLMGAVVWWFWLSGKGSSKQPDDHH